MAVDPEDAEPIKKDEWSAGEHRTLIGAVKPGDPSRKLEVYATMRGNCRKQLNHVKKRVDPGIARIATRAERNLLMFSSSQTR